MSNSPVTSTFYADTFSSVTGDFHGGFSWVGAPDGNYFELDGGYTRSTDTASLVVGFGGVDSTIPKYAKITQVLVESHMQSFSDAVKAPGSPHASQWGILYDLLGSPGVALLQTFSTISSGVMTDLGVSSFDVSAHFSTRDDLLVADFLIFTQAVGSAANQNAVRTYNDYFKLSVTWVHPPEERMVI